MGALGWTSERVDRLRDLYARGVTFSAIAADLGLASRSAAIGKAHRLGLVRPAQPKGRDASVPPLKKPAKQNLHPGNIARKAASRNLERMAGFEALADKAMERFDAAVAAARPNDDTGVLFLERGLFQCAMPMPGWDDAPIAEKRVCGRPVKVSGAGGQAVHSSYCSACYRIVYAPPRFRDFKDARIRHGVVA